MLALLSSLAVSQTIENEHVLIDMTQNNPGDAVAWQQSKYFDAQVLKEGGYTAQSSTGETSGTQGVDFHTTGIDFFPAGSPERVWLDAYSAGVQQQVESAKAAGVKAYFFVDLLVFPTFVIDHYKSEITSGGRLVWNNKTASLTQILIDETFAKFPGCDGFIVRTGETYTYDTPYHKGNSPCNHCSVSLWVEFITALRAGICEKHGKDLFIRSWDNWPSEASYYLSLSNQIPTHKNLYFSIKYTAGDFLRNEHFNGQLGVGNHAQIVEVELQREYEGKGAYPNYVMDKAISGPQGEERAVLEAKNGGKLASPSCLNDLVGKPQLKGLWTWTRGGGWWGPYIHGNEIHIDLHYQVMSRWWRANFPASGERVEGGLSEEDAFTQACEAVVKGCTAANGCCAKYRTMVQAGAQGLYLGKYGGGQDCCHMWLRDDRIGTMESAGIGSHSNDTIAPRVQSLEQWALVNSTFTAGVLPHMTDPQQKAALAATVEYGMRLFGIIEAGWTAMVYGYAKLHSLPYDEAALTTALANYDARWAGYRAFGLANRYAASLYHDYYLCLGTECTGAFNPPSSCASAAPAGIGSSIDKIRKATPPPPPAPTPAPKPCESVSGFTCKQGVFCSGGGSTFTNWSYSGSESIDACASQCTAHKCTCFIHSAAPTKDFPACRTLSMPIKGYFETERGYSAWTKQ